MGAALPERAAARDGAGAGVGGAGASTSAAGVAAGSGADSARVLSVPSAATGALVVGSAGAAPPGSTGPPGVAPPVAAGSGAASVVGSSEEVAGASTSWTAGRAKGDTDPAAGAPPGTGSTVGAAVPPDRARVPPDGAAGAAEDLGAGPDGADPEAVPAGSEVLGDAGPEGRLVPPEPAGPGDGRRLVEQWHAGPHGESPVELLVGRPPQAGADGQRRAAHRPAAWPLLPAALDEHDAPVDADAEQVDRRR